MKNGKNNRFNYLKVENYRSKFKVFGGNIF
jgi:hypothetical protein